MEPTHAMQNIEKSQCEFELCTALNSHPIPTASVWPGAEWVDAVSGKNFLIGSHCCYPSQPWKIGTQGSILRLERGHNTEDSDQKPPPASNGIQTITHTLGVFLKKKKIIILNFSFKDWSWELLSYTICFTFCFPYICMNFLLVVYIPDILQQLGWLFCKLASMFMCSYDGCI